MPFRLLDSVGGLKEVTRAFKTRPELQLGKGRTGDGAAPLKRAQEIELNRGGYGLMFCVGSDITFLFPFLFDLSCHPYFFCMYRKKERRISD